MAPKSPRARDAAPDRRVLRTRRQLRTALINLILERGWDAVSVSDVCARADVGRSTFYAHFADKEELLFSGFEELHATLATLRKTDGSTVKMPLERLSEEDREWIEARRKETRRR